MKINRVDHVAIALHDDAPGRRTMELLGLVPREELDFPEYEAKMANYPVGDLDIELMKGTSKTPIVGPHLDEHGEGIFHICLEVEDLDGAIAELSDAGVRILMEPMESMGRRVVFLDPATTSKIFIELAEPHPVQAR